jgi:hypothetical protein
MYFPNYFDCFRDLALPQVTAVIWQKCVYEKVKRVEGEHYGLFAS